MTRFNVRYMVNDVDAAVAFYTTHLGFTLLSNAAPAFADVTRVDLRLLLSGPTSSAGRPMPDGRRPAPGRLESDRVPGGGHRSRSGAASCGRTAVPKRHRERPGGSSDRFRRPSGNPIELFQPAR